MKKILLSLSAMLLCVAVFAQEPDWANFKRYADANKTVTTRPVAVLMGDSITDCWMDNDPNFFKDHNLVGRGISGQTTSHMLTRFREDVVALHPKYVCITGGTNDVGRNWCWLDNDKTMDCIESMCEIAKANKIKPVLCTIPPSSHIFWREEATDAADRIKDLNARIRTYAAKHHYKLVDYAEVLAGPDGYTDKALAADEVHPNHDGYLKMEALLLKVLKIK